MAECFSTNINSVPLSPDICEGETKSTVCVIHSAALTYLGLPANSTQEQINEALLLSLIDTRNRLLIAEQNITDLQTP